MLRYVIRRLLLTIPTLFLVATIVFLLLRLVPGDMVDTVMARLAVLGGSVDRAALERAFGLDAPLHVQYVRWWADLLLRGSLGISMNSGQPVVPLILGRLPVTIELGLLGMAVSVVIGLPVGIYSALRQDTAGDYAGRSLAILFVAAPSFWVATLVILYASLWWGWSPPLELVRLVRNPIGNLRMFILPSFILGMVMAGTTMRMTRTMMLEVLRQDFIREGVAGAAGGGRPRAQERADPGGDGRGGGSDRADRRRGDHRIDLRPAGNRAADGGCLESTGLRRRLGRQPGIRSRRRRRQPAG